LDLEEASEVDAISLMSPDYTPQSLIDMKLIETLRFCHLLYQANKVSNDDYASIVLMKSVELGKKRKQKVLVFDMDETLVSAWKTNRQKLVDPD
jgi:hypothetical protein